MPIRKAKRKAARAAKSKPRASRRPPSRATGARPARPRPARPGAARTAPSAAPNAIGLVVHHMDYTSHDMAGVRRFYTETLGFGQFHHDPDADYLTVVTSPDSSLGFMPPMPGPPEQWRPPREPALYFIVADVDRVHRDLTAKGVEFDQAPADMPWGHRVARLRDPEGRSVGLAQIIRR